MRQSIGRFIVGLVLVTGVGAGTGLGAALVAPGLAGAATPIAVNDAGDATPVSANCVTTPTEGDCTLRAAIEEAESLGTDVDITLPNPNTVPNNPAAQYAVDSGLGQLDVNDSGNTVSIDGSAGQTLDVIQAQCLTDCDSVSSRVLKVESGTTAVISGVTIEDGDPSGAVGGGILDCGTLTLSNSTVTTNTALDSGGGIELSSGGSATLTDDTVSQNTAEDWGGGIDVEAGSNATLNDTIVSGNSQTDTDGGLGGGGIYVDSEVESSTSLTVDDESTITANNSVNDGGGIEIDSEGQEGTTATVVDISDSTVSTNTSDDGDGDGFGGGVSDDTASTLTVTGSEVIDNAAGDIGGGVSLDDAFVDPTLTLADDTISGNTAGYGAGGIYVDSASGDTTDITDSTISGNTSTGDGGGAGIVSDGCNVLNLTNDTIANNVADANDYDGGGYLGVDCDNVGGSLQPAAAGARPSGWGNVVPHSADSTPASTLPHQATNSGGTTFLFDTFNGNTTGLTDGAANISQADDSNLTFEDTIVAGGSTGANGGATGTTNCFLNNPSTLTSLGYNLIDDSTCGTAATGDIIGQGAQLGALGNNGGPTNTELPASTSPAVGGVPPAVCSGTGITTDQRGNARGAGLNGSCTIGAVEVSVAAPPAFNPNGYRLVANEGGIFDFGLNFDGSLANNHLNAPIIGIANSPGFDGYVMAGADGGVFALGGANFYGSLGGQAIPSPISAIAAPPTENGYWLAAQNGRIYNFGASPALPALSLPAGAHIVGMASTQDGQGAWLTDQLGDVYAEGDAHYVGGLGGVHINKPIVGIAAAASGQGYVLAASDGGVFNYGTQGFFGSVPGSLKPGQSLVAPIVGIAVTHSGNGYWEVGADGGVFNYGDAPFLGSIYTAIGNHPLNGPIVGIQHLGEPSA